MLCCAMNRDLGERYSPLLFLGSLGAGGAAVTFFLYLLFWVPHPKQGIPVFEDVTQAFANGSPLMQLAIGVALIGIVLLVLLHVALLLWNLREMARFRQTAAYTALRNGNHETQLTVIPLTLAMTVNAGFIVGAVFVPGLWTVVEWLFPLAMIAFLVIGIGALHTVMRFFARVFTTGGFDCTRNNSLAQVLPAFALSMVAVGLSAPAALSQNPTTAALSLVLSSFFITAAVILGAIQLVLGFRAMLDQGATPETLPTLWIIVPILTVLTIAFIRQQHGLGHHFEAHAPRADTFAMLMMMVSGQVFFGVLGAAVMLKARYFQRFVLGTERSPGALALVCPAVALTVMGQFFINQGLVGIGLVAKFGLAYQLLTLPVLVLQLVSVWLLLHLTYKLFFTPLEATQAQPALN